MQPVDRRKMMMKTFFAVVFVCFTVGAFGANPEPPYDIVIRNGHILDGTGSPWYSADLGIRNGRIAAIGHLSRAQALRTIDAHGMIVAPGFIDMLGQSELSILVDPRVPSKIFQGITTEITGEGSSVAPINETLNKLDHSMYEQYQIAPDWRTFREYFARLEKQGIGINIASYVGATQVRRVVIGDEDKDPTQEQLEQMKLLVRQAMEDGAVGVSTALEYPPAPYAKTEELIALAGEAAPYGGIYATHLRSEGDAMIPALDEAFRIGREAKIPVEIWHLKMAGRTNFGRMPEIVSYIEKARASGLDVTADTYAYTAWGNSLDAFIPPWAHNGGTDKLLARLKEPAMRERIRKEMMTPSTEWDNEWDEVPDPESILVRSVHSPDLRALQGKTIADIAKLWNKDPIDTIFELLIQDSCHTGVAVFGMSEPDVVLALQQPWVSVNNDSEGASPEGLLGQELSHPRAYGTFPRILRKYVREEKKLTLEDAIRKFTSLAAQRMLLTDRGVLKAGLWADIVIFDPNTVRDVATFDNPNRLSEGMQFVLVNGIPVIDEGTATNKLPGHVLRGSGFRK
jgi:dihydroorotase/N-acyl-D-amino-acid deacylase